MLPVAGIKIAKLEHLNKHTLLLNYVKAVVVIYTWFQLTSVEKLIILNLLEAKKWSGTVLWDWHPSWKDVFFDWVDVSQILPIKNTD